MRLASTSLVVIFTLFSACGGQKSGSPSADLDIESEPKAKHDPAADGPIPGEAAKPAAKVCEAQPEFRYEYIAFPPQFAPELPAGYEEIFFAPGMFQRGSAGYWSYSFALVFNKPIKRTAEAHMKLLDTYYKGLVKTVGKGVYDLSQVKTRLIQTERKGEYFGTLELFDAFDKGAKLQLKMRLFEGPSCLLAMASIRPLDSDVWETLTDAANCLACAPGK